MPNRICKRQQKNPSLKIIKNFFHTLINKMHIIMQVWKKIIYKIINYLKCKNVADKLKKSLIFNVFKMLVLIFSLLYLLFKFLPHEASVNYESSDIESFFINSKSLDGYFKNVESLIIDFKEQEYVYIQFINAKIEGTDIQNNFGVLIFFKEYSDILGFYSPNSKYNSMITTHPTKNISIDCKTNNNEYNYLSISTNSVDSQQIIWFSEAIQFYHTDYLDIQVIFNNKMYPLVNPTFIPMDGGQFYIDIFGYKTTLHMSGEAIEENIKLNKVSNINAQSSGVLDFFYTPEGKQYDLRNQNISLISKNNTIQSHIKRNGNKLNVELSGRIDEAYISSLDLFPTFRGWYRDNIYLIPLTLISTIFGAIKLKEEDKK